MHSVGTSWATAPRILRGRGQVPLRHAFRLSFGESIHSKSAHISTLVWGMAFGLMSAAWSPPRERPFVVMGAFVIAAAIGYGSMFPWRWRLLPRRCSPYLMYILNGGLGLLMGMTLFFAVITIINWAAIGDAALQARRMQNVALYALYGFQFPLVGFYITIGSDLTHRGNIQRKEKERFQRLAEQSRLVMLRSQINPHFFFNALNTIAALIPQRPADAERAVELLATALRPVLTRDQPMIATLETELQVAHAYADIERLRFGSRCEFRFDISNDTITCTLPSLTLQPLLENAVRHGAAHYGGAYRIALVATCESSVLRITIVNGPASHQPIEASAPVLFPNGHALHNIDQRLQMLFGKEAALQVFNTGHHSGRCELQVPQAMKPLPA